MRRWSWLIRALAAASLLVASCGGGDDEPMATSVGPPLTWDAGSWDAVTWQ